MRFVSVKLHAGRASAAEAALLDCVEQAIESLSFRGARLPAQVGFGVIDDPPQPPPQFD